MTRKACDYPVLFTTILLVSIGIVMIFSASYYYAFHRFGDYYYFFKRQLGWAGVGLVVMIFTMNFDYWRWEKYGKPLLLVSFIMLAALFIPGLGIETNDAVRWLGVGSFRIQPSEVAKLSLIIYMAASMAKKKGAMATFTRGVLPYLIILIGLFGLIIKQPNLSTAGIIVMLGFILMFVGGTRLLHLFGLIVLGGAGAAYFITSAEYRLERFLSFTNPWNDPLDTGYQVIQSLYSLGSGGLFGTGLANSMQKYLYIPEPQTDFIFAIIGEELGFIGSVTVIILFMVLIWRGIKIAITAPDSFACFVATGITSMIALQVILNIAVVTSSIPPTGVPLPFITYGGSSLLITMASIGILLNISRYTKMN
ncbi:MAG: stage V sporulation protein E [Mahellales bacterium]|jgi:cell division protein FtsW